MKGPAPDIRIAKSITAMGMDRTLAEVADLFQEPGLLVEVLQQVRGYTLFVHATLQMSCSHRWFIIIREFIFSISALNYNFYHFLFVYFYFNVFRIFCASPSIQSKKNFIRKMKKVFSSKKLKQSCIVIINQTFYIHDSNKVCNIRLHEKYDD